MNLTIMKKLLLVGILFTSLSCINSRFQTVFICTSDKDDSYHLTDNCMMLDSCSQDRVAVTLRDAVHMYQRILCELEE